VAPIALSPVIMPLIFVKVAFITAVVGVAVGAALYEGHEPFRNWVDEQLERHRPQAMGVRSSYCDSDDDEKERDAQLWELRRSQDDDDSYSDCRDHRSRGFDEKRGRSHESWYSEKRQASSSPPPPLPARGVTTGVEVTDGFTGLRNRTQGSSGFQSGAAFGDPFSDENGVLFDRDDEQEKQVVLEQEQEQEQDQPLVSSSTLSPSTSRQESESTLVPGTVEAVESAESQYPPLPPRSTSSTLSVISGASSPDSMSNEQAEHVTLLEQRLRTLEAMNSAPETDTINANPWSSQTPALADDNTTTNNDGATHLYSPIVSEASMVDWNSEHEGDGTHTPSVAASTASSVAPSYHFVDEEEGESRMASPVSRSSRHLPSFQPQVPSMVAREDVEGDWTEADSVASWESVDSDVPNHHEP